MSAVQDRLNDTLSRADEVLRARVKREVEQLERENAARADEARVRARRNAERCREHQARFSDAFAAFGTLVPAPIDGERSVDFRDRLWNSVVRKLPPTHAMASIYADDLSTQVMDGLEPRLLAAATAEGLKPSEANLPDTGMISRIRVDSDTGEKRTEWHGKRSFIADMTQSGRRVLRLINPKTGDVLLGAPFSRAR